MGSNIDLRKYQDSGDIEKAFSALVSGKRIGYKTIIERKKILPRCIKCEKQGNEEQRFCSDCGGKMFVPLTNCPGCKKFIEETEKFCTNCGFKLKE